MFQTDIKIRYKKEIMYFHCVQIKVHHNPIKRLKQNLFQDNKFVVYAVSLVIHQNN